MWSHGCRPQNPDARIAFASGSTLYETSPMVMAVNGNLNVSSNVLIQGSSVTYGRNLVLPSLRFLPL